MNRNFILVILVIAMVVFLLINNGILRIPEKGFALEEKKNLIIYVAFNEKFVCIEKINDEGNVVIRTRERKSTDNIETYLLRTYKHEEGEYLLYKYWNITIEELTGMEPGEIKTCEDSPASSSSGCFISTME